MNCLLTELEKMPAYEAKEKLDMLAQEMKNSVISAADYQPKGERVVYLSNDGNDADNGLSEQTPIRTLARLAEVMADGDTVLFRRGDRFRGLITVRNGVTLSAYGKGVKPIIDGSYKNYADKSLWEKTDAENVWHLTEKIKNIGLVHCDPTYIYGSYDEKYGKMRMQDTDIHTYSELASDLEFFSDLDTDDFYLYSEENPATRFTDIALCERSNIIGGAADNVTIDNLWIMHTGGHGMGGAGGCKNRVVTNCIFSWLGGSILARNFRGSGHSVRYGNAVEIYGSCDGFRVENNWMYQIYDTAVTHQFSGGEEPCIQRNIRYLDNLMEFCFWSIEYYNAPTGDYPREVSNVYMTGNFCRFGGYGWGCRGREGGTPMYCGSRICDNVSNFIAEKNIFYQSLGYLVVLSDCEGHKKEILRSNVYVQPKGANFARLYNRVYTFTSEEKETLKTLVGEDKPVFVFLPRS